MVAWMIRDPASDGGLYTVPSYLMGRCYTGISVISRGGEECFMSDPSNRQWRLAARPEGLIKETDFEWLEEPVRGLEDGEVLVRNIYLSLDPANRGWVREGPSYVEPVGIGDVMRGLTIGVVEASRNDRFAEGDTVTGAGGWQDYGISDGTDLRVIPPSPLPLTAYLGLFGMVGLTAYFGLLDVGKPQAGETLVVSGAAGAVGSIVGQIGKIVGCRVVGIAGSDAKCSWLTDELGFDAAVNYKTESVARRLHKHCPDGIDVIFENVGGEILDAELMWINNFARVVICGLISAYNATGAVPGPYMFRSVLVRRARIQGFVIIDYMDRTSEAIQQLSEWYADGKLKYRVDVYDGLETAPRNINRLFDGSHEGKLIIKVSDEP
jgi:NADPH-dependent curcumin reductase CurA